jgi:hydrogenase maturation protease
VPRGEKPGTVYLIKPEIGESAEEEVVNGHSLNPAIALRMAAALGGKIGRVLLVGCEPGALEESMGLSAPVAAAVPRAVAMIAELLEKEGALHECC